MNIYFDVEDRWTTKANTAESLGTLGPLRNMGACMPVNYFVLNAQRGSLKLTVT